MRDNEIATRDEILELLTEEARDGSTGGMIALERALRAHDREETEIDQANRRIGRFKRRGRAAVARNGA